MLTAKTLIAVLFVFSMSSASGTGADKRLEDAMQNVINQASEVAFDAGWCSAMVSLGKAAEKDKELGRHLRDYLKSELDARQLESDELADFCLKATGRSEFYTKRFGKMLKEMNGRQANDPE